jgi:hypothetical protein
MKFWEAMKAMEEGKKVRCTCWAKDSYVDQGSLTQGEVFSIGLLMNEKWELYEETLTFLSFAQVMQGLKEGRKFRRKSWKGNIYIGWHNVSEFWSAGKGNHFSILVPTMDLFVSSDWEEVKD